MVTIDSELHIGRECDIYISRIVEFECLHRFDEFSESSISSDTSIVLFLFSDGRHHLSGVVMSWIDTRLISESIDLSHDRVIQLLRTPSLEVCTTRLADEECITCEYHVIDEETRTTICMSWSGYGPDTDTSDW